MILIDFNTIVFSSVHATKEPITENLLRHMILNSIRGYKVKFQAKYGETIIVTDGGGNWRKKIYPEYKANRKIDYDKESKIDWKKVFSITNNVLTELKDNFPYRVLRVYGCEADDTIAQLVIQTQEFGKHDDVMIVSSDGDFKQLQKFSNVSQFSTLLKKPVVEKDPIGFLTTKIFRGDGKDGVPNVLSHDQTFVNGERQSTLSSVKLKRWLEADNLQEAMTDKYYRNYIRNKKMVDLEECPKDVKENILKEFHSQSDQKKNASKVFNYLIKNRCYELTKNAKDFV